VFLVGNACALSTAALTRGTAMIYFVAAVARGDVE
jgi:hypothetical protein